MLPSQDILQVGPVTWQITRNQQQTAQRTPSPTLRDQVAGSAVRPGSCALLAAKSMSDLFSYLLGQAQLVQTGFGHCFTGDSEQVWNSTVHKAPNSRVLFVMRKM